MTHRSLAVVLSLTLAGLALPLGTAPAQAAPTAPAKPYDVDGNGYPELVVGAPNLRVGSHEGAGGVVVLPASRKGLSLKEQVITLASPEVVGQLGGSGDFGTAFASADFDRDGYADLAVGRPETGDTVGGAVTVLFGGRKGLSGRDSVELVEPGDGGVRFGSALATGDLDADGWPDLAVGDPDGARLVFDDGQDVDATGTVTVFRGGSAGFGADRSTVLRGQRAARDHDFAFGSSLAVGDLDADGRADLVIGTEGRSYDGGYGAAGSVTLCPGTSTGLPACTRLAAGRAYASLSAVAIGNVAGTARPEIVLGVPAADLDAARGGAVETLTLSGTGTRTTAGRAELTQDTPGVPGTDETFDRFGTDVVLGDLDHDGYDDLVVGAPWEDVGSREDAGAVTVVHGGPAGYRTSGNQRYDQGTRGVPGKPETYDNFGATVALFDHDQDGRPDLTVGAPREDFDSGAVTTLRGARTGFTTKGARTTGLAKLGYRTPASAGFGGLGR